MSGESTSATSAIETAWVLEAEDVGGVALLELEDEPETCAPSWLGETAAMPLCDDGKKFGEEGEEEDDDEDELGESGSDEDEDAEFDEDSEFDDDEDEFFDDEDEDDDLDADVDEDEEDDF